MITTAPSTASFASALDRLASDTEIERNEETIKAVEEKESQSSIHEHVSAPQPARVSLALPSQSAADETYVSRTAASPSLSSSQLSSLPTPALTCDISSCSDDQTAETTISSFEDAVPALSNKVLNVAQSQSTLSLRETRGVSKDFTPFVLAPLRLPEIRNRSSIVSSPLSAPPSIPLPSLPGIPKHGLEDTDQNAGIASPNLQDDDDVPVTRPGSLHDPSARKVARTENLAENKPADAAERPNTADASPLGRPAFVAHASCPAPEFPRVLRSAKSSSSLRNRVSKKINLADLLGNKAREAEASQIPSDSVEERRSVKTPIRRRRTSLSIRIPKLFSRPSVRTDEQTPDSAIAWKSTESRFSPDSDTPVSTKCCPYCNLAYAKPHQPPSHAFRPASLVKRLQRAVSTPNLKHNVSGQKGEKRAEPKSAPPMPGISSPRFRAGSAATSPMPTAVLPIETKESTTLPSQPISSGSDATDTYFNIAGQPNAFGMRVPLTEPSVSDTDAALRNDKAGDKLAYFDMLVPITHATQSNERSDKAYTHTSKGAPNHGSVHVSFAAAPGTSRSIGSAAGSSGNDDDDDDDDERYRSSNSSSEHDDYGGTDSDQDSEEDEDELPLAHTHAGTLQAQRSLRDKLSAKNSPRKYVGARAATVGAQNSVAHASPSKRKSAVTRNPFGFSPDELSRKSMKGEKAKSRSSELQQSQNDRPPSLGDRPHNLLLPQTDEQVKRRNRSKGKAGLAPPLAPFVQDSVLTMSEGSDDDDLSVRRSRSVALQSKASSKRSVPEVLRSIVQPSPVNDHTGAGPSSEAVTAKNARASFHSKQRIYIEDPQHHFVYDIDENTTPLAILAHLREQGIISSNPAWTVMEMWRSLGVERPIRTFEYLQDIMHSWSTDPNASLFLVKKSPIAGLLSQTDGRPACKGFWTYTEVKRGKWSKRFCEVRNGTVYVGKSEKVRSKK